MRKLLSAYLAGVAVLAATAAMAGPKLTLNDPPVLQSYEPIPAAQPGMEPIPVQEVAIPLYHCVRYKSERDIAPCAVPMIVMVKDPCDHCNDPCDACAAPRCVAVEICVPPCQTCPPKICCKRGGEYVKYDFGKYSVKIVSRRGVVTVDYDD